MKSFSVVVCLLEGVERSAKAVDILAGLMMAGTLAVLAADTPLEVEAGLARSFLRSGSSL